MLQRFSLNQHWLYGGATWSSSSVRMVGIACSCSHNSNSLRYAGIASRLLMRCVWSSLLRCKQRVCLYLLGSWYRLACMIVCRSTSLCLLQHVSLAFCCVL
jgi:hypothetical protein